MKDRAVDNWPLPAGIAVIAIGFVLVRRKRRPGAGTVQRRDRPRERSTVAAVYDQALKLLARHGASREPWMTPRELASQLAQRAHAGAAQLGELTESTTSPSGAGAAMPRTKRARLRCCASCVTHSRPPASAAREPRARTDCSPPARSRGLER